MWFTLKNVVATNEVIETGVKEGAKKIGEKSRLEGIDTEGYEGKVHGKFLWTKVCVCACVRACVCVCVCVYV